MLQTTDISDSILEGDGDDYDDDDYEGEEEEGREGFEEEVGGGEREEVEGEGERSLSLIDNFQDNRTNNDLKT